MMVEKRSTSTSHYVVYETSRSGHRQSYADICNRLLGAEEVFGSVREHFRTLFKAPRLICSTCDEYLVKFCIISLFRAVSGKDSFGIAIRAEGCLDGSWRNMAKRLLFRFCLILPKVKVLSILPFSVEPRLATLVNGWIYDPQFWDLPILGIEPDALAIPPELVDVKAKAAGRLIVASLGTQNSIKGSDYFCELYSTSHELSQNALFVIVGSCKGINQDILETFCKSGGLIVDRYVSEAELLSTYLISDVVWSCYSPNYNQSSGIFGRSLQFCKPMLVRKGSYLEKLQMELYGGVTFSLSYSCSSLVLYNFKSNLDKLKLELKRSPSLIEEGKSKFVSAFDET